MSDLLTALARRALQPPAIRPRLASRFEGEGAVPRDLQRTEEPAVAAPGAPPVATARMPAVAMSRAAEPSPAPSPNPPSPSLRLTPLLQEAPPRPTAAIPVQSERVDAPAPKLAERPGQPEPQLPLRPLSETAQAQPPTRLESRLIEREHREQRIERQELHRELIERRVERLLVEAPSATPTAQPLHALVEARPAPVEPQPVAPRVEISIGRIEILPAAAAAAPRQEAGPRRPPAKSLDEYLNERNGSGGRRP